MAQRVTIRKPPPQPRFEIPERTPDWEPTLSEDPGRLQGLLNRLVIPTKRAINTAADVMFGSTPEEQALEGIMGTMGPGFGTAATTARRAMRPLLMGALDKLFPNRSRPPWSVYGGPPRPVGPKGVDPNMSVPFTSEEVRRAEEWIRDPLLQKSTIPRHNEPEWDEAEEHMDRVMDLWAAGPTDQTRRELDEIGRNTEFGRHYLDRLHGLLREIYPSGQVPLYRGLSDDELKTILAHGNRPSDFYARSAPMLQSFSLSPNMARSFSRAPVPMLHDPGGRILYGNVPIKNIRGHVRSPTMQEEELIVDVLPRRRDDLPDWSVAPARPRNWKGGSRVQRNWAGVRHPTYWQNVFESRKVPDDLPRLRGSDDDEELLQDILQTLKSFTEKDMQDILRTLK